METKQILKHYVTIRAYKGVDPRFNGEHVLCYIDEHAQIAGYDRLEQHNNLYEHGQITCYDRLEQHNTMSYDFYLRHTQPVKDSPLLASYQAAALSESPDCLFVKSKRLAKPRLIDVKEES